MVVRLILWAALLLAVPVRAEEPKLVGSTITTEAAEAKCNTIFVGQVLDATGKVRISQMLEAPCHCQYTMETRVEVNPATGEAGPQPGRTYIFFTQKRDRIISDAYKILKMLPATESSIAGVRKVISG